MDLGERIALWRKHKGLTQQQLAEAVGVTVGAVYQWEGCGDDRKHHTAPSVANLEKLVAALGLTMGRFYGRLPRERRA
jgi:transcriptional regulator with XRE-family HTH domain